MAKDLSVYLVRVVESAEVCAPPHAGWPSVRRSYVAGDWIDTSACPYSASPWIDGMPALSTKRFARSVVGELRRMGVKCKVVRFAEVTT